LDSAIRLLDGAILQNPHDGRLYLARARLLFMKQDFDAAMADATEVVRLDADSPDGYKIRALVHTIRGEPEQAVAELTKAIEIDPTDPDVFKVRGNAYQALGEDAKAEADFAAADKLLAGD
jgi:tetratricopeptide (TPR) repeat protein